MEIKNQEILVSYDVVSLFTNIPINTAINIIMKKWDTLKKFTNINKSKFLEMLKFCLIENNYFMYEDKIYHQVFGMPMGNPLSPIIADIVLDNILDDAIRVLEEKKIRIKFITKYVDDILAIIDIEHQNEILSILNNQHPKIKFTVEMEKNEKLSYLDVNIHRDDNKMSFDWYTKPTATGRLMNFNSTQPKSQIINTAKNFIERVLKISDRKYHMINFKKIYGILEQNGFPKNLIKILVENSIKHIENKQDKNNIDERNINKKFYSVQYIPGLTDNKKMRETIKQNNISFAYKPNKTLNTLFTKIKAPIQKQQKNNVIYEIRCKGNDENSCEKIYIGTTKRAVSTRINEHKMDVEKQKETTALSQHLLNYNHTADFDKVRILGTEGIEKKRYIKESLYIQKYIEKTMNIKEDTRDININYKLAVG